MKNQDTGKNLDQLASSNLSGSDCGNSIFKEWKDTGISPGAVNYTEVRQGTCNDCYFIAALISVAYAASGFLKTFPNYTFYAIGGSKTDFSIDKQLAVDSQNQLVYAFTKDRDKTWPGFYEKAYAMWLNNDLKNNQPSMATICGGGNGLTALQHITGAALGPRNTWPPFVAPTGKTKYPTTAQTKPDSKGNTHTYSVLKKSGGLYYLLNPCGGGTETYSQEAFDTKFGEWGYVITG